MNVYQRRVRAKDLPVSLGDTLDTYFRELSVEGKPSARNTRSYVDRTLGRGIFAGRKGHFCLPSDLPIAEIDEEAVYQLRVARRGEGLAPQTVKHELGTIRAALRLAERRGFAVPKIRWDLKAVKEKTRWLTYEEWRRVWGELEPMRPVAGMKNDGTGSAPWDNLIASRQRARDLFAILTFSGARMSEVLNMTLDQVEPGRVRVFGSKTGEERYVACPPIMDEAIARRREAAEAAKTVYLFPARQRTGEAVMRLQLANANMVRKAMDRAGLNAPHLVKRHGTATIHTLRHTFASWMRQSGEQLATIQALLGHASERSTARYAHLASGAAVEAATARLDEIAGKLNLPEKA